MFETAKTIFVTKILKNILTKMLKNYHRVRHSRLTYLPIYLLTYGLQLREDFAKSCQQFISLDQIFSGAKFFMLSAVEGW